jgi:hypothetical protein
MKKLILLMAFMVAAAPAARAQFSPGTVIGNVYQNPAAGYGYGIVDGFGLPYAPPYGASPRDHAHRHQATGTGANR